MLRLAALVLIAPTLIAADFDSAAWDRQLEADASAGKLDALLAEAEEDYKTQAHRKL